ncbi:MAG: SdrD B-like domain-containing protein [Acidobacteriota bacterium]
MNIKAHMARIVAMLAVLMLCLAAVPATAELEHCATASVNDVYGSFKDNTVLYLPGIGEDYHFTPAAGIFIERPDGTASLTGTVRDVNDPSNAFEVNVQLSGYTTVPEPGNPYITLDPSAYAVNGGPVDTNTWHYYRFFDHAVLTGIDGNAGAIVELSRRGGAWQVGNGANNHNINFGVASWITWFVVQQPDNGAFVAAGEGEIFLDLGQCDEYCVESAEVDPVLHGGSGGHSFWLPGIGKDFVFLPEPGIFTESPDGTARITGSLIRKSNPNEGFEVDVQIGGYTTSAPAGSPKKELRNSAYVDNGGPIDPSTWWYYTEVEGTLTGTGELGGAVVDITRRGPALQVGDGANNKNGNFGLSTWFDYTVTQQPTHGRTLQSSGVGDINIDLGFCVEVVADWCPAPALYDGWSNSANHAVTLPGIAKDMFIVEGTELFVELSDGTARFIATVYDVLDPNNLLVLDVIFEGYTTTPPPGSPKRQLPSSAYVDNGGPVDPSTWWYYTNFYGTATGAGNFAGAVVRIDDTGPAFQVGVGASNKTVAFGASGWIDYTVLEQPDSGSFPSSGTGDFNMNLGCPEPERATIGDFVWHDEDNDGVQDLDEVGIEGVTVELLFGGSVVDTTVTNPGGLYTFDVAPGLYTVRVDPSTLGAFTIATYDLDGILTTHETQVSVGAGLSNLEADFGYRSVGAGPLPPANGECRPDDFGDGTLDTSWGFAFLGNADQGGVVESGGQLLVTGDGTTFYTGDDTGAFAYQTVDGDFRAEIQLDGFPVDAGGSWRKAGLTVRLGDSGSRPPRISVQVVSNNPATGRPSLQFTYRDADGATGRLVAGEIRDFVPVPIKLAIERRGTTFTVSYSTDGGNSWIIPTTTGAAQGVVDIPNLAGEVLVGPNVVAYSSSTTLTAAFDDFEICQPDDTTPPDPPNVPCVPGAPLDVIYLLDVSGSMTAAYPGAGSKLDAATQALYRLNMSLEMRPGVRAALLTFAGFRNVPQNLAQSTDVVSSLSTDFAGLDALLMGLDTGDIDINSTTPTALALRETLNYLVDDGDPANAPVVILVTDGVPNIDLLGQGPDAYDLEEVQDLSLFDSGGDFLPSGLVAWLGNYNGDLNVYDGQVLADSMTQIEALENALPAARIFGVALQGDGVFLGTFNEDLLQYAAFYSGGVSYSATDAAGLLAAMDDLLLEIDCGEGARGSIGDRVWNDADGDGVQDPGEQGLSGVGLTLEDELGNVVANLTTGPDGFYLFDDLLPGIYTVRVNTADLAAYPDQTYDFDGLGTPDAATVELGFFDENLELDFGYMAMPAVVDPDPGTRCELDDFEDGTLDPAWQGAAIGDADQGSFSESNGRLLLTTDGSSLYTGDDDGFFAYQTITASNLRAEVDIVRFPVDAGGTFRKAGLMIRGGLADDAPRLTVQLVPHHPLNGGESSALQFSFRNAAGAGGQVWASVIYGIDAPVRVAIEKRGDVYRPLYSLDSGATWIEVDAGGAAGIANVAMGDTVLVGVMGASYDADTTLTAEFDNFVVCEPDTTTPTDPNPPVCDPETPLEVVFLLDMSGSMTADFPGASSKFTAALEAIRQAGTEITLRSDNSSAALLSFAGFSDVDSNLNNSTTVRSPFTSSPSAFQAVIDGLDVGQIDVNANTPTAISLRDSLEFFQTTGGSNQSIFVLITDGVPNIDGSGRGPTPYDLEEVQDIGLRDTGGAFLPAGTVGWLGNFNPSIDTYDGQTLADSMRAIEEIEAGLAGVKMYGVAIQGDGVGLGTFNEDLLEYAAFRGGGQSFSTSDASALTAALMSVVEDIDCSIPEEGEIRGTVFDDTDLDGAFDAGEPGLAATVRLFDNFGDEIATVVTADGAYAFTELALGAYDVVVEPVDDTLAGTVDPDGTDTPNTARTILDDGEVVTGFDFGYGFLADCGCEGGVTRLSLRYDGLFSRNVEVSGDGGTLFAGVVAPGETIEVVGGNPDGTLGATTTITLDGAAHATLDTSCDTAIGPLSTYGRFAVVSGNSRDGAGPLCEAAFGPATSRVSGVVVADDENGVLNAEDAPLEGVTVRAKIQDSGAVVETAVTGLDGSFSFNLVADLYDIEVDPSTLPAGYADSFDRDGGDATTAAIGLADGDVVSDAHFGYLLPGGAAGGQISVTVRASSGGDPRDPRGGGTIVVLEGVPVSVRDSDGNIVASGVTTASPLLLDIAEGGTHTVELDMSGFPGYTPSSDPDGVDTPNVATVNVAPGTIFLNFIYAAP